MEEEKTTQLDQEKPDPETEERQEVADVESCKAEEEEEVAVAGAAAREKRGRLIMAGLAAATVATLVAVIVAGLFQFTSKWLTQCPRDRTANGPALILWKGVISDKTAPQPLGVPEKLLQTTKLKTPAPLGQESGEGKDESK
jgi:hypothetical protein